MRIVILDLKWSYGIEAITGIVHDQLEKWCEVTVISAAESRLPYSVMLAKSRFYREMLLAFLNPLVYLRILRQIRQIDPQIVYILSPHMLNVPIAGLLRFFSNACVISHIHDPEHAGSPMVAMTSNLVARLQSRWSHRVYCWGRAIKGKISQKFNVPPERIAVFCHGPGHKAPSDDLDGVVGAKPLKYFSMIGTIIPRKGVEYYLEAARLFNERHGSGAVQFLLAGSGNLTRYKGAIERLSNLVVVNRFLEDGEVNECLAESYASVLPYTSGVMQSSFIAIAYGNGCPAIVSNIGSLPEEVENGVTGYVVDKANPEQIAAAMSRIYTDPARGWMKENCVARYRERFNWDAIAGQMYRDMEKSVSERRSHIHLGHEVRENQQ